MRKEVLLSLLIFGFVLVSLSFVFANSPSVTTLEPSEIGKTSVKFHCGDVNTNNREATGHVVWRRVDSTSESMHSTNTQWVFNSDTNINLTEFYITKSSLIPNTKYLYKCAIQFGPGDMVYGDVMDFTTLSDSDDSNEGIPKTTTCSDTDGGAQPDYAGVVMYNDEEFKDECDGNTLIEYYCENNEKKQTNFSCQAECLTDDNGAGFCSEGSGSSGLVCPADSSLSLPEAPVKSRAELEVNNEIYYCGLDKQWNIVKDQDASCVENYECASNTCLDGQCYSVKQELEKQTGFLTEIYCILTNLGDYLLNTGEKKAYNSCLSRFIKGGETETDSILFGRSCQGTALDCEELVTQSACESQKGNCSWGVNSSSNSSVCSGTATACSGLSVVDCTDQKFCFWTANESIGS